MEASTHMTYLWNSFFFEINSPISSVPVWVGRVFLLAGRKEGTVVKPRWRLWNMHDSGSCVWEEWVEVCWGGGGGLFTVLLSSCSCGVEWGEKCEMCFMSVDYCFTVLDNFFLPIFIICLKIHKGSVICSERDCKDVSSVFWQSWIKSLIPWTGPFCLKDPSWKLGWGSCVHALERNALSWQPSWSWICVPLFISVFCSLWLCNWLSLCMTGIWESGPCFVAVVVSGCQWCSGVAAGETWLKAGVCSSPSSSWGIGQSGTDPLSSQPSPAYRQPAA